ncbi:MAG: hypothetical protein QM611_09945 [Microbacterium sp.]|uniref:hypothetical protein n=1 Tax=Microbacterium sp. TaxID=51671 RepID=UPI0039E57B7F
MQLAHDVVLRRCPLPLLRHHDLPHPERGLAHGSLVRVRHGVYASTRMWDDLAPWDRYLCRVHAVALHHPDAVFCLESAAVLSGLPIFGDPVTVHVLVPRSGASRHVAGVRTHRSAADRTIVEADGLLLTSPLDTAVDTARHRHNAIGLAVADAALRVNSALRPDVLVAANEARSSSRGRDIARWPLSHSTPLAETALESISRAVTGWLGFPPPELQVAFRAESGEEDRVDLLWRNPGSPLRQTGIAGEADGQLKYDGRFGDPSSILRKQSRRDIRLREHVRSVTHWGWWEATRFRPLRAILVGAGLPVVAAENTPQLFSLKRALSAHVPPPPPPPPPRENT